MKDKKNDPILQQNTLQLVLKESVISIFIKISIFSVNTNNFQMPHII